MFISDTFKDTLLTLGMLIHVNVMYVALWKGLWITTKSITRTHTHSTHCPNRPLSPAGSSLPPQPQEPPILVLPAWFRLFQNVVEWDRTVCCLFWLASFIYSCAFKVPPRPFMAWELVSFYLNSMNVPQFIHHLLEGICLLPSLGTYDWSYVNICVQGFVDVSP